MGIYACLKGIDIRVQYLLRMAGRTGVFQHFPDQYNRILSYHSVGGTGYGDISPDVFRSHLEWIDRTYEIVDIPEVIHTDSSKRIALTFDDGYRSFYEVVYPIIREYSVPVTVFIIGLSIEDPEELDPERRYMTKPQLLEIANEPLITIGSHTMTHTNLSGMECAEELSKEINGGTEYIESTIGINVDRFCYPHNAWSEEARRVVRERHEYAVRGGGVRELITDETDPYLLPRISGETTLPDLKYEVSDFPTHVLTLKRSFEERLFS